MSCPAIRFAISGLAVPPRKDDHSVKMVSSKVVVTQTTAAPADRKAAASRLMFGTISRAIGTSDGRPGFRKAICMSTTTRAVRAGSSVSWTCSLPPRRALMSLTASG